MTLPANDNKAKEVLHYRYSSLENPSGSIGVALEEEVIKRLSSFGSIQKICELGCGNGHFARRLAGLGYHLTAIDSSESGIQIAKSSNASKVDYHCLSIGSTLTEKIGENCYEAVVALEVVEHLYQPADLIQLAQRLLKPGGYLVLTTPYHGYLKNLIISLSNQSDNHFNPLWDGGHIKFFSPKTLTRLITREAELRVVRMDFIGRLPFLWKSMICTAQKKLE